MWFPAVLLLIVSSVLAIEIGDDLSFQLDLIKHQPCNRGSNAKWTKKLEFESGTDKKGPKLEPIADRPNCYTIGGKVDVLEDFHGEFSIYLELRNTASKRQVPESCVKQGADGCGGFGSCLYCNACKTFGDNIGVQAQLLLDGNPIKCSNGLAKGTYNNLKLAFCLPKMEDILRSQGLTKETFLQLVRSDDGQSVRSMGIFATVYIFDTDVSKQMQTQARIESVYRKTKKSFFKVYKPHFFKFSPKLLSRFITFQEAIFMPHDSFITRQHGIGSFGCEVHRCVRAGRCKLGPPEAYTPENRIVEVDIESDEPLPADVYWSLPFNMMIKNQQVFVACHKIYGNLKINQH